MSLRGSPSRLGIISENLDFLGILRSCQCPRGSVFYLKVVVRETDCNCDDFCAGPILQIEFPCACLSPDEEGATSLLTLIRKVCVGSDGACFALKMFLNRFREPLSYHASIHGCVRAGVWHPHDFLFR